MYMLATALLAALTMSSPVGDRLLAIDTPTCRDWAEMANEYIAMGEEKASAALIERSQRPKVEGQRVNYNTRTALIARLIFEPKDKTLRRPGIPIPFPIKEGTKLPFMEQDGVFFLMPEKSSEGSMVGPEPTVFYVHYLRENAQFRKQPYKVPTWDQAKAALQKLYNSPEGKNAKWDDAAKEHLAKQVVPGDS